MRFVLYTHTYSPHEMPLFLACADVFDEAVYVVDKDWEGDASRKGWQPDLQGRKTVVLERMGKDQRVHVMASFLTSQMVVMYGRRGNPYESMMLNSQAIVIYASERWLKPDVLTLPFLNLCAPLPGILHILRPSFIKFAVRYVRWLKTNPRFFYFGEGAYACEDMLRLCKLLSGCFTMLWRRPAIVNTRMPISILSNGTGCASHVRLWGYFVESACGARAVKLQGDEIRVLWVGRFLALKHVDMLVEAVKMAHTERNVTLDLYGRGPSKEDLLVRAKGCDYIRFHDYVDIREVRNVMREHDVYVLCSDGYEGWGAVINEALEEEMLVLSSRTSGAGATMLPEECLFDVGDVAGLANKLCSPIPRVSIGDWNVRSAAQALYRFAKEVEGVNAN